MKDPRLAIIIPLLLVGLSLLVGACAGGSSSGGDADWSSFTTMDGPGLTSSNLDELSRKAGFRFVLPSYIPQGVSRRFFLSSQLDLSSEGQGGVGLTPDDKAPRDIQIGIQIDEHLRSPWSPRATGECHGCDVLERIGGIYVGCTTGEPDERWPTPAANEGYAASLTCIWDTEELSFLVQFGWRTESGATPEVTPERRDEAMKVITSMIEDPYVP